MLIFSVGPLPCLVKEWSVTGAYCKFNSYQFEKREVKGRLTNILFTLGLIGSSKYIGCFISLHQCEKYFKILDYDGFA